MNKELKVLYLMALGKKPINFRIWATHKAIMLMFAEATEEKYGIPCGSTPYLPTFSVEMKNKVAGMILDYVRFDDGK